MVPASVEAVLIDRPEAPPKRVGEPASESVWPAMSNAIYDAIGFRLRQMPFTPERVLAGLAKGMK
jgi:CO/xanthine dehydrogenase Mo-binding subunit